MHQSSHCKALTIWQRVFELLPLVAEAVGHPVEEEVISVSFDRQRERRRLRTYRGHHLLADLGSVLARQYHSLQYA